MSKFSDPAHPIWPTLRVAIVMTGVTALLWRTAQNFDYTEHRLILAMLPILAGAEISSLVRKLFKSPPTGEGE